jgi:hypothetical protein
MVDKVYAEPALDAEPTPVDRICFLSPYADNRSVPDSQNNSAAHAAIRAYSGNFFFGRLKRFGRQCSGGTADYTLPAASADRVTQGLCAERADPTVLSTEGKVDGADPGDFMTGPHAFAAQHAFVRIEYQGGMGCVNRPGRVRTPAQSIHRFLLNPQFSGKTKQLTGLALFADQAVIRMARNHQFHNLAADPIDLIGVRFNNHSLPDRRCTGCRKAPDTVDPNNAQAASPIGF